MRATTRRPGRAATYAASALCLLALWLALPAEARAQWTPPDASGNISNTNTGNVGINITVPSFKFEVRGGASRNTASFTGDGDSVGYAGVRIAAFTTTNIANNRAAAFIFSMRKDTWYGGDGSGPSFIIEVGTKGYGFAAPFVITPTNDILLNSGRGAGGPAGAVPSYGNVGIGTHTPAYKLDVGGSVNASGLCLGGDCKTAWSQVGGFAFTGSNISFNTGNVGLGTTSPAFKLDAAGAIRGTGDMNVSITNQSAFTGGGQQHYFDGGVPFAPLGRGSANAYYGTSTGVGSNPGGIFIGGFGSQNAGAAGIYAQGGDTHSESYNRAWGGVGLFAQGGQNGPHTGGPYGWAYSRYAAAAFFNGYVQIGSNDGRPNGLAVGFDSFNGYGAKLPPGGGLLVNGSVGVGTAAPSYKLDVQGGQVNASGGLCIAGDCRVSWSQVSGGGGSTQWTTSGTNIYYNSGNVGVGTSAPAVKLHVAGGERVDGTAGRLYLGTGAVQGARGLELVEENATTFSIRHHDPAVAWQNIAINPYGGNVGVGTPTPRGRLEVAGGPLFLGDMGNTAWGNMIVRGRVISSNNNIHLSPPGGTGVYIHSDYREAGGPTGPVTLNVSGNITGAGFCLGTDCKTSWSQVGGSSSQWTTSGSNIFYNGGAVGIGNNAPGSQLFVGSGTPAVATLPGINVALGPSSGAYVAASNGNVNTFIGADGSPYGIVGTLSNHPLGLRANNALAVTVLPNGNVGVGTTNPTRRLEVSGAIHAEGAITGATIEATYQDVAEWVPSTQKLRAGTVVVLDTAKNNHVAASAAPYDTKVAGVVSAQPGVILGVGGEGKVKVATTGRVRVRVDASRGAILVGDLLVTSDVEGVAMKSVPVDLGGTQIHRPGTIIGKALEPLAKGVGDILVLLSLQ